MMKRLLSAILCALLIMSLSGCKNETVGNGSETASSITETAQTLVTDVTSANDESENSDDIIVTESVTETTEERNSTSETIPTPTEKETTEKAQPPTQKVEETKPEETTSETTDTTTTVPSTETTSPKDESTIEPETQVPEQTEPPQAFDIEHWVDFAKNYAQSKGLTLDAGAIDCWDNPIRAGAHCIYLERDIQSRLNRYAKDEDITDVWIWIESVGNDCYDIYIGYA